MIRHQLPPELQRVHMVGIGGAGMSGIARILLDRGAVVSGSDAKESRGVLALRARGADVRIGHHPSALDLLPGGPTAVITTHAAIPKTNPELVEAHRRGVPVVLRPDGAGHADDRLPHGDGHRHARQDVHDVDADRRAAALRPRSVVRGGRRSGGGRHQCPPRQWRLLRRGGRRERRLAAGIRARRRGGDQR